MEKADTVYDKMMRVNSQDTQMSSSYNYSENN